jgi:predicted RNA-binding protein YlqC (UPF0109 family)
MEQLRLLLALILRSLVDHPDTLSIELEDLDGTALFRVRAATEDIGKIIGSQGRTVRSIRTCLLAAATKKGLRCTLEVSDGRSLAP